MNDTTGDARPRRRARPAAAKPGRSPDYRRLLHPFTPQTVLSEDEVHAVHQTSLRVLEELGMKVTLPEARELFAKAGAIVEDEMVRIGRDIIEDALASAPRSFRMRAASPAREQDYRLGSMIFMGGTGCPNASDAERGRRAGSIRDFEEAVRLSQSFDVIHMLGPHVEAQDVPINLRHYATLKAQIANSDKPMFLFARGRGQVQQGFEMMQTAFNLTTEEFENGVWLHTIINTNSPRLMDKPMAQGLIDFARANQMCIVTPFCLAGAMAPVSLAGALTLQHAEALSCVALMQIARKGCPVSYGGFSSNVYMKSGAPAFGTPEHVKLQLATGQLARMIGLPWRTATGAASNTPDMQAALETNMALWGSALAQGTLTIHSAGWLEGGLTFGFEKFINDIEGLQMMAELTFKTPATTEEIGFSALQEVPPGGHFFAAQHTMERYATAFYEPLVADLSNFGNWTIAGSKTSAQRATEIWKRIMAEFVPPPTAGDALERLQPYIDRAAAAGGAFPLE